MTKIMVPQALYDDLPPEMIGMAAPVQLLPTAEGWGGGRAWGKCMAAKRAAVRSLNKPEQVF